MRIAILHYSAPPVVGGVESAIGQHARWLAEMGHSVRVIAGEGATSDLPRVEDVIVPDMSSRAGLVLEVKSSLDRGEVPPEFDSLRGSLGRALEQALQGCDVVIVHNACVMHKNLALTSALHELSQRALRLKRWIGWHHDVAWRMQQYRAELHMGEPWSLLRAAWPGMIHVTVSPTRKRALAELFDIRAERIHVVRAGIDLAEMLALTPTVARIAEHVRAADLVWLQPARITRRKNIEYALRALGHFREQTGLDARLLVSGPPGPHNPDNRNYLQSLFDLRRELKLDGAAHFLSAEGIGGDARVERLTDSDLGALYRLCDLVILPSTDEGFGIPVLEALAVGRAIVCSDLPPLRTSGGSAATYIDPHGPPEQAANAILELVNRAPVLRRRRMVLRDLTWRAVVQRDVAPLLTMSGSARDDAPEHES